MSAPERIYLQWYGDGDPEWDNEEPECADVTWAVERVYGADIVYRREQTCAWTLSDDGLAEYITPHGDRVPSSHVLGFRRYTNCPYCGGRIEVTK